MSDYECVIRDSYLPDDELLEERSLHFLKDSKIDQAFSEAKAKKKAGKKHKVKWMRRPMVMPEAIIEFLDEDLRENAIRYLSNFLVEKREEDPDNYKRAGFLLYNSCATMTTLLQEVVSFFRKMSEETLNVRSIKRLANVLTLFQCIAANQETRQSFVNSGIPDYLIPMILFECKIESFDNIRAIVLSVIGILCQVREPYAIDWAIKSNVIEVCHTIVATGSELDKVIAMHILEAILQDKCGISYFCSSSCNLLLCMLKTWDELVNHLAEDQEFSPRLLFHIIRCYMILCSHERGYAIVVQRMPIPLTDGSFDGMIEEFPIVGRLLHQLLLCVGKAIEEVDEEAAAAAAAAFSSPLLHKRCFDLCQVNLFPSFDLVTDPLSNILYNTSEEYMLF